MMAKRDTRVHVSDDDGVDMGAGAGTGACADARASAVVVGGAPVAVATFVEDDVRGQDYTNVPEHALVTVTYKSVGVSLRKYEIRRGVQCVVLTTLKEIRIVVGPPKEEYVLLRYNDNDRSFDTMSKLVKGFHSVLTGIKPPDGVGVAWAKDEPEWILCGYGWRKT
jgi:hypothetical protein